MLLIEAVNTSLSSSRLKDLDIIMSHRTFSYFKIISILSKTSSRYHMVPSCFLITPRKFSTHYHLDVPLKTSFHSHAFSIDILIKFSISLIHWQHVLRLVPGRGDWRHGLRRYDLGHNGHTSLAGNRATYQRWLRGRCQDHVDHIGPGNFG